MYTDGFTSLFLAIHVQPQFICPTLARNRNRRMLDVWFHATPRHAMPLLPFTTTCRSSLTRSRIDQNAGAHDMPQVPVPGRVI